MSSSSDEEDVPLGELLKVRTDFEASSVIHHQESIVLFFSARLVADLALMLGKILT